MTLTRVRDLEEEDARLDSFRSLKPDWHSYGTPPINPLAIDRAKEIARILPAHMDWYSYPTLEGGVVFENDNARIEIHFT